jgi:polar amino acid transport system substrate-binding protein
MRPLYCLLIAGMLVAGGAYPAAAQEPAQETIKAYTADLPPWTNEGNEARPGFALEVMREMVTRSGLNIEIEMTPWRRAQEDMKTTPNTMGFHLFRTPERETSYDWHFSILQSQVAFVSTDKPVNSIEEAKGLARVVVVAGTPQETEMKKAGADNLEIVDKVEAAVRMLESGRVDAFYTIAQRASYAWSEAGFPLDKLVMGEAQRVDELFVASNKQMPAGSMEKLKAAFDSMKEDGTYAAIAKKYFGEQKAS